MDNKLLIFIPKIYFPAEFYLGPKSLAYLKTLPEEKKLFLVSVGFKKANSELCQKIIGENKVLEQSGEPTLAKLNELEELCRRENYQYLVALGGGSVIDLAKAVKLSQNTKVIAIPTTIGSGAEVSQHVVLIDEAREEKKIFSGSELLPEAVLFDSNLYLGLPLEQLRYEAVDGFAHAIESLVSRAANPISDSFALMAIEMIDQQVKKIQAGEKSETVLLDLKIATTLAGLAQSSAATGLAHSFAHFFGPRLKITHARAVTLFLKDVLTYNLNASEKYQKLEKIKGWSADNLLEHLTDLTKGLDLPKMRYSSDKYEAAEKIKRDICTLTNPVGPKIEDLVTIINSQVL